MENYDSSIETLKHIKQVALYTDLLRKELQQQIINNTIINDDINKATLLDLIRLLLDGYDIPFYNELFKDINNNSKVYKLGYKYTDFDELYHLCDDELYHRGINHDKSKLEEPEKKYFDIWTPRIKEASLGTPKYEEFLDQLRPALIHHYQVNDHHPEHNTNGINGMHILSLSEMLCDWQATCDRHDDGDIYKSIEILSKKFNYEEPMKKVLSNTCDKCFRK
jgi:hypothetical protein